MSRVLVAALAAAALVVPGCFNPRIHNGGFACSGTDPAACPSGFACVAQKCVMKTDDGGGPAIFTIAKTSTYMGLHLDPQLGSTADCPDESLEPNDGPGARPFGPPIAVDVTVDTATPRVQHMAICPSGANPATGQHDLDWFKVVTAAPVTMVAQAYYDVAYGDLDLAIVDGSGKILVSDGSARSDACASVALPQAGSYFVVVVGAEGSAVNRYDLRVRTYSQSMSCSPSDMGPAHD